MYETRQLKKKHHAPTVHFLRPMRKLKAGPVIYLGNDRQRDIYRANGIFTGLTGRHQNHLHGLQQGQSHENVTVADYFAHRFPAITV
jgi:hypothetical protein